MISHGFEPVFDEHSKILILGSMPSVQSLRVSFYYGHPQNRFWPLLEQITNDPVPSDIPGKKSFLLRHHIALYDVISACERTGSLDSAIREIVPADLSVIPNFRSLAIFTNGKLAAKIFAKQYPDLAFTALPSTSPANRARFDPAPWLALRAYL